MEGRLFQAEEGGDTAVRARGGLCASREDTSGQLRMSRGLPVPPGAGGGGGGAA